MNEYALYLESGPRMKTTMVHVLDLTGCFALGPTTDEAIAATPDEIRMFLRFLRRHGDDVDPEASFTTNVVEHVIKGSDPRWGNPARGFPPDFEQLDRKKLHAHARRVVWLGQDLAAFTRSLSSRQLLARPPKGRSIHEILRHVGASEVEYVRVGGLAKSDEMKAILKAVEASRDNLPDKIEELCRLVGERFEAATDEELKRVTQRGAAPYTARRGLRRALEHPWEHLREIECRLGES
jgi:uncharacterized damage-inducible protein DinB